MSDQLQPDLKYIKLWMQFFIDHPLKQVTQDYLEEWIAYCESKERENAELKQQITLLSGVFSREEELQSHITELNRIIDEANSVYSHDFERLKELGWQFNMCEICGESLSVSKPTNNIELLGYAHRCDDYDGSVISTDKDEYGDKTVTLYKIKDTK